MWASQNNIVNGIGKGLYGTNAPTTQEQLATMLWRDAGSYVVNSDEDTGASAYAVNAVRWLKAENLLNEDGPAFEPKAAASRAQNEMLPIAAQEWNDNARPAIKDAVQDFDSYDTIFLGYPIWWGGLPMILHTFMESYDFTGKTVIPFNTHEGSGQSGTQSTIANKLSGAAVLQGLAMRGSTAQNMTGGGNDPTVKNWLDGLGGSKQAAAVSENEIG